MHIYNKQHSTSPQNGIPKSNSKYDDAFKDRPDLAQYLNSASSPSQVSSILGENKRTVQTNDTPTEKKNQTSKSQQTLTTVENIQSTLGYSTETPFTDTTIFGKSPVIRTKDGHITPHQNIPMQKEMRVYEAEHCQDDESE